MILVALLMNFFPPAFAGHPDQDPKVAAFREHFKQAVIPSNGQPSYDSYWSCVELKAIKDDYRDTLLRNFFLFMDVGVDGHIGNTGSSKVSLFAYQKPGLVGAYSQYLNGKKIHYLMYVRLDSNNTTIVAEYSVADADLRKNEKDTMAVSAANPDYRAVAYYTCTL